MSRPRSRTCARWSRSRPTAKGARPGARTPAGPPAPAAPGDTCPVVSWLQPLTSRSLQESRGGSDRAQRDVLLVAMVTRVVVELALDLPVHIPRGDAVVDDEMLLFRSRRVEEHRFGAEVDPDHVVRVGVRGLGGV